MSRNPVSKACDACRRRKVRCSLRQPCAACQRARLQCTFLTARLKKGRKGDTAKVLNELHHSQAGSYSHQLPTSPFPFQGLDYTSPAFSLDVQTSPQSLDILPSKSRFSRSSDLLPSRVVELCAELFFSQLGSTVPIITPESIRQEAAAALNEDTGEDSYCLISAFCAFVILQTGGPDPNLMARSGVGQTSAAYGQHLLKEALSARSYLDLLAAPTRQTVLLTFFIYGCHSALGKHRQAWYFLREATTLYTSATLDLGDEIVDEVFSRLYWLLLISERSHAIRRRRPITLQITPQSPTIDEAVQGHTCLSGFRYLADLFRPFDDNFIALWNRASTNCDSISLVQLEEDLRTTLPTSLDIVETQLANIRVSQQWLRVIVWQLCTMMGFLSSEAAYESLTFRYPLKIAQDLAISTWKLSLHSMQMHGIGLTEKVFDIACTLIDVMSCMPSADVKSKGFEIGPEDNLKHFCHLISQLPGGRHKYLPLLVTKVDQTLPNMLTSIARHLHLPEEREAEART
ncbi:uncharacterized protein Z518_03484 [Rhinocladiella mackenziei CBS 650.93]|uniref:Zn(2)-C6 fungal-type domain-containing protein n=1 Tax=Rhinocladiella mackenziei CBS 650.93 TaxID=1442369 RepID=A0A0D2G2Q0_9EURO|nr:uncharacterized protein Z518_03484 [Rhinocladiella mackenziei CBS 650.93]KIX08827.1 hypothetical protein Z518_03484 [Rhinocladiella mackenziei CBS 650.93]